MLISMHDELHFVYFCFAIHGIIVIIIWRLAKGNKKLTVSSALSLLPIIPSLLKTVFF